ncbi:hypothetical protein E4U30_001744 [Claviceps sp. LM220 group G6]|nr:hypothetical protein E4U14_000595 [Claviceps sp. LM454 group G7]KAG6099736.1 hypothetical protein E4U31_004280 [Claviceps sp. LM219 group G6]KAG6101578.1 hypothetical protein E4U30_001744 [Claviceps sp. LM220 group G6]
MRLLNALTFASGIVALATGPVQPRTDQQTVQGDASLNPENAVIAASDKITSRDDTVPSLDLDKRMNGAMATILMPQVADAAAVVIAGVSVSFIMASRVIRRQGQSVTEWFVRQLRIHNQNPTTTVVQIVANGANFYDRHMKTEFIDIRDAPEGLRKLTLVVSQQDNEL